MACLWKTEVRKIAFFNVLTDIAMLIAMVIAHGAA